MALMQSRAVGLPIVKGLFEWQCKSPFRVWLPNRKDGLVTSGMLRVRDSDEKRVKRVKSRRKVVLADAMPNSKAGIPRSSLIGEAGLYFRFQIVQNGVLEILALWP